MRAAGVAILGVALASGCANLHVDTRVERGPLLRTFEREATLPAPARQARVTVAWPSLEVSVAAFDLCRKERVEESIEEKITEITAPGAGPAIGTGVTNSLVGGGLLLLSGLFSAAPNTRTIDAAGHYGPSDRQIATGWGLGLLVIGLPALVTGAVELVQTGERTETRKMEQVASSVDTPCHPVPAAGTLLITGEKGGAARVALDKGRGSVGADALRSAGVDDLTGLTLNGEEVLLDDEDRERLEGYRACLRALPMPPSEAVTALDDTQLHQRFEDARRCRKASPDAGGPVADALGKAIDERRKAHPETTPGPRLGSFEDAVAAYVPAHRYNAGSADLGELSQAEALKGQAVVVEGVLAQRLAPNVFALDVGSVRVFLFVQADRPWAEELEAGTRVEALGVMAGKQALGDVTAPLVRAVWVRSLM